MGEGEFAGGSRNILIEEPEFKLVREGRNLVFIDDRPNGLMRAGSRIAFAGFTAAMIYLALLFDTGPLKYVLVGMCFAAMLLGLALKQIGIRRKYARRTEMLSFFVDPDRGCGFERSPANLVSLSEAAVIPSSWMETTFFVNEFETFGIFALLGGRRVLIFRTASRESLDRAMRELSETGIRCEAPEPIRLESPPEAD